MKGVLTFLTVLMAYAVQAQSLENADASEVYAEFSKVSAIYAKQGYSLSYQRVIYRNAADADPMLTDKGSIFRGKNTEYRSQSTGNLTIQNNEMKIVVDSVQKLVSLFKTDTLFQTIDLKKFMDQTVSERYSFKRELSGNSIHYILIPKSNLEGITEIWINKNDFEITRIEMLLPKANYFSESMDDATLETPRLIFTYDRPKAIDLAKTKLFDCSAIIEKKNNEWFLVPSVTGYTLHDSRITTK